MPTKVSLLKAMVFPEVIYGCESWPIKESWASKNWCFWTVVLEKTLESPLDYKEIQPIHLKGNQSWIFIERTNVEVETNSLATWCKELIHWKRPWFWERLKAGGEGDARGWDSWMASPTGWKWVLVSSGSWWWTGKPEVLQSIRSQRVGHNWATELNWTELNRCREQVSGCTGLEGQGRWGPLAQGGGISLWGDENVLRLDCKNGSITLCIY